MKTFCFTVLVCLLGSISSIGQSFQMTTSSDSVLLGNHIIVSFTASNIDGTFEAPDFDGMRIISGPNTSSSIQIINGDRTSTQTYSYYIEPGDVGSYTISPAYLVTETETLESLPVIVNVFPNPENIITPPKGNNSNSMMFEFGNLSPFGQGLQDIPLPEPPPATPPTKAKRKYKRI